MTVLAEPAAQPRRGATAWLDEITTPSGLFLTAVVLLALIPVTSIIRDPDFWWHLRTGELIAQHGGLLGTDPFTYTVTSHAWTMHEWLTELLYAGLYSLAGLALIVVVLSAVTWIGLLLVLRRARLRTGNRLVLGAGLLLAVLAGYPIWGPRVQMVTFCFSALTLLLLERHLVRGGRAVWALVPLFVVWSNLHSGFVIGLGFIAVVFLAEVIGRWLRMPDGASASRARTLPLLFLACAAASMINPNGPGILLYAIQTQSSAAQQALILEWHSPDFHDWVILPFGVMLVSLAVLIAVNGRIRARDAALVLLTTALALQSVRHIALFVAATTPMWIDQTAMLVARRRSARVAIRHVRAAQRHSRRPPLRLRTMTWAVLVALLLVAYGGARLIPVIATKPGSLVYAQEFPVCAARWLARAPQPLKVFNQYGEGGFLVDQLSARGDRVFIFGDAALMGDNLLYTYARVEGVQPGWDSTIRDAGTDIVLFDTGTPLANVMLESSRWVRVYQDPLSVAFVPADRLHSIKLAPVPQSYPPGDPCGKLTTSNVSAQDQNQ